MLHNKPMESPTRAQVRVISYSYNHLYCFYMRDCSQGDESGKEIVISR